MAEPFCLDVFLSLPRMEGLTLSPDGRRLVSSVALPDADGKRFAAALWELDPAGRRPPRRLTRSASGESRPVFLPSGALLFLSTRPDPDNGAGDSGDDAVDAPARLWLLPAGPGEPRLVADPPGGADALVVARAAGTVVLAARTHPGTADWVADRKREQARQDAGVAAQLFDAYPVRFWDRWLGPRQRHLYALAPPRDDSALAPPRNDYALAPPRDDAEQPAHPRDLTPEAGWALDEVSFDVTADGATVVTGWWRDASDPRERVCDLVAIDVATGRTRTLAADGASYGDIACSPDGRWTVCVRTELGDPDTAPDETLWLVDLDSGAQRDLTPRFDRWPKQPVWTADSAAVLFVADDGGHTLPFRQDLRAGQPIRLADEGAFEHLAPAPDGTAVYALRHSVAAPPHAVTLDPGGEHPPRRLRSVPRPPSAAPSATSDSTAPPGRVQRTASTPADDITPPGRAQRTASTPADDITPPGRAQRTASTAADDIAPPGRAQRTASTPADDIAPPGRAQRTASTAADDIAPPGRAQRTASTAADDITPPGRVERSVSTAADGTRIGAWLVLPPGASPEDPAPLVLFVHGGPLMSWSGWHWRWNPHVFAARGYAVLLPDPAESTGYGRALVARGWGRWGEPQHTDLMAAVDAAVGRRDIDGTRTAALGASFGGYMVNWIAGHSDRFRALVTHAGLWSLHSFHGTTDVGVQWEREFGDPYADPARYRASSPDAHVGRIRTPMLIVHGERDYRVPISEALTLWTDLRRHGVPAKFLYFPDEHHWITKPQNARLWYETVLAFLDHHVLGRAWTPPTLL